MKATLETLSCVDYFVIMMSISRQRLGPSAYVRVSTIDLLYQILVGLSHDTISWLTVKERKALFELLKACSPRNKQEDLIRRIIVILTNASAAQRRRIRQIMDPDLAHDTLYYLTKVGANRAALVETLIPHELWERISRHAEHAVRSIKPPPYSSTSRFKRLNGAGVDDDDFEALLDE